jgi:hypothetical protein
MVKEIKSKMTTEIECWLRSHARGRMKKTTIWLMHLHMCKKHYQSRKDNKGIGKKRRNIEAISKSQLWKYIEYSILPPKDCPVGGSGSHYSIAE